MANTRKFRLLSENRHYKNLRGSKTLAGKKFYHAPNFIPRGNENSTPILRERKTNWKIANEVGFNFQLTNISDMTLPNKRFICLWIKISRIQFETAQIQATSKPNRLNSPRTNLIVKKMQNDRRFLRYFNGN